MSVTTHVQLILKIPLLYPQGVSARKFSRTSLATGSPVERRWGGVAADWEQTGFSQTVFPRSIPRNGSFPDAPHPLRTHSRHVCQYAGTYIHILYMWHSFMLYTGITPYQTGVVRGTGARPERTMAPERHANPGRLKLLKSLGPASCSSPPLFQAMFYATAGCFFSLVFQRNLKHDSLVFCPCSKKLKLTLSVHSLKKMAHWSVISEQLMVWD